MAFGNLTVDFKSLSRIPIRDRAALARSPQASEIFGNMTPSQIAALFPDYYKRQLNPMAGQVSSFAAALSGAAAVGTGSTSGGGGSTSATPAAVGTTTPSGSNRPGFIQEIVGGVVTESTVPLSGDLNVKDRRSLIKGTYDAFIRAGYTDKQARALVAEVGRENSFRAGIMFGEHAEPGRKHQGRTNSGIFSMAAERRDGLLKYMSSQGLLNPDGRTFPATQASLDAMARYARLEMSGDPNAPVTSGQLKAAQNFLAATEADQQEAGKYLAGWIAWDIAGRHHDAGKSIQRRDSHRQEIDKILIEAQTAQPLPGTAPITGQAPQGSDVNIENLVGTPADASVHVVPAPQGPAKTMLLSLGTNDFADPKNTYQNTLDAINEGRKKGYNVVVVPPVSGSDKFKAAYDEVMRAVNETGAPVEQPQSYSQDGYHPTGEEYKRIGEKYQGAVVVGDSIAVGIGKYTKNGQTVATKSIRTDAILARVKSQEVTKLDTAQVIPQTTTFDANVFTQLDPRIKEYYDTATDDEKRILETAITQKGVDAINKITSNYPATGPTAIVNAGIDASATSVDQVVDDYLWQKYQKSSHAEKYKDEEAAKKAGMSVKDFVIGGTDRDYKMNLYTAGKAMDAEGLDWTINSMYRDDYRNVLAYDGEAGHKSHHGTSNLGYTYGTGRTADISAVGETDREQVYKWIDTKGGSYGIARPYGAGGAGIIDVPHVGPLSSSEMTNQDRLNRRQGYLSGKDVLQQLNAAGGYNTVTAYQRKSLEDQLALAQQNQINQQTAQVAQATPAMKLGGEQSFKEPNSTNESMSLVSNGEEVAKFNKNEKVSVGDGKINVQNEYQKKADETQQKTDKGVQQNIGSMKAVPDKSTDVLRRIPEAYSPISPSASRAFSRIKPDRHWEKGLM